MGIRPPKGVILYGVPGTGKTLLAKAVANQTSATFLRIVGSELIQKYLGDGPKLVRELFRVAEEHAPSIVFIDEIDAIGTKRWVSLAIMVALPNALVMTRHQEASERSREQCWSFLISLTVSIPEGTSRSSWRPTECVGACDLDASLIAMQIETLDPALIRPGRIDRKIGGSPFLFRC